MKKMNPSIDALYRHDTIHEQLISKINRENRRASQKRGKDKVLTVIVWSLGFLFSMAFWSFLLWGIL